MEYDLSNDESYNESCTQCLSMEWMFQMFRLTGKAVYMDAAERSLYNAVPGCVDLEATRFFYCNPQEQTVASKRKTTPYGPGKTPPGPGQSWTWRRVNPMKCSCCPPKVLRALAMSAEMAYVVNDEGLWVNLYGSNICSARLPWGDAVACRQTTDYPWERKVELRIEKCASARPFTVFLRIPGWLNSPARITLNGQAIDPAPQRGAYYPINRQWVAGDRIEAEFPMPVRFMIADPKVKDTQGKVAVMRGPVVYCLEGDDVPEGVALENVRVPAAADLKPVFTKDLGGVIKLTGSLVHSTTARMSADKLIDGEGETALYRQARFAKTDQRLAKDDRAVTVSMIPYYARLNRKSDYFRIWLPVY